MTVVALVSAHGSPGVTTTALALTWVWPSAHPSRRVVLVDADCAGSGLLTGYLQAGVRDDAGVLGIAADRATLTADAMLAATLGLDSDASRMVLPGVAESRQARSLGATWGALAGIGPDLDVHGVDVVVDIGRIGHRYEPTALLHAADVVVVVLEPTLASVAPALAAVRELRADRPVRAAAMAAIVGTGPYGNREVRDTLGAESATVIAHDQWAAKALANGGASGWRFDRSPLLRSVRALADQVALVAPEPTAVWS